MLMGPWSTSQQCSDFAEKIRANPRNFIAQPVVTLSTCPTWTEDGLAPRHVDLRPYIVSGTSTWVLPGGLTRTALVKGRWWSIRARAAAARTPGSWRTADDLACRRALLLDEPLPRAGREHRPGPRGQSDAAARFRRPARAAVAAAADHQRHPRHAEGRGRRDGPALPDLGHGQPCQHRIVALGRARERPDHPRSDQRRMWERLNYYYLWMQSRQARALYDDDRSDFYSQIKRINQLM